MKHHLKGYLAGLSVLIGETEKPEVLSCLHQCKESLQVCTNNFNIIALIVLTKFFLRYQQWSFYNQEWNYLQIQI